MFDRQYASQNTRLTLVIDFLDASKMRTVAKHMDLVLRLSDSLKSACTLSPSTERAIRQISEKDTDIFRAKMDWQT